MLFNRKNARVTIKLLGVLGKISISLNDPSLSTEDYKKQLGQKIVTIKWVIEQQINFIQNCADDREHTTYFLNKELEKPVSDLFVVERNKLNLKQLETNYSDARRVIAFMGDELEPLLLAYERVADREEFAQLINAGIEETGWKSDLFWNIDRDTTNEEYCFMCEHLFLNWMVYNQYRPFKSNPLSFALWESEIEKLRKSNEPDSVFPLDSATISRRIAADKEHEKIINEMINNKGILSQA